MDSHAGDSVILTPLGEFEIRRTHRYQLYQCQCGTRKWIRQARVEKRQTLSCGCMALELMARARRDYWQRWRKQHSAPAPKVRKAQAAADVVLDYRYWNRSRKAWDAWAKFGRVRHQDLEHYLHYPNPELQYRVATRQKIQPLVERTTKGLTNETLSYS